MILFLQFVFFFFRTAEIIDFIGLRSAWFIIYGICIFRSIINPFVHVRCS